MVGIQGLVIISNILVIFASPLLFLPYLSIIIISH